MVSPGHNFLDCHVARDPARPACDLGGGGPQAINDQCASCTAAAIQRRPLPQPPPITPVVALAAGHAVGERSQTLAGRCRRCRRRGLTAERINAAHERLCQSWALSERRYGCRVGAIGAARARAYLINGAFGHLCGPNRESQVAVKIKCLVRERRSQKGGLRAFPLGPLPHPDEASKVAICNGSFTSIRDIQSLATNVRNPPQPCGASIDWHSCVVS